MNVIKNKPAVFYFFADTHFGNPGVCWDLLQQHIKNCKREKAGWFHMGDWCEFITPNDRRFSIAHPPPSTIEQIEMAIDTFKPIKKQCVAVIAGNHESTISRYYGDVMMPIVEALNAPYLGYSGFVSLRFHATSTNKKTYNLFLHHGHGMGALLGAKAINLHRMSHKFEADIYAIGHIHTWQHPIDEIIGVRSSAARFPKMIKKRRYYFSCPSYFDPYIESEKSNYVEQSAMYPQPNGCVRMEIEHRHPREEGRRIDEWTVKIEAVLE